MTTSKTPAKYPDPGQIESIFILKPDNLGDVLLFTGALRRIRNHFSQARITLCTKSVVHPLLHRLHVADELIPWEPLLKIMPGWIPNFPGAGKINSLIRRGRFISFHRKFPADLYLLPVRSTVPVLHQFSAFSRSPLKYGISGDTNHITAEEDNAYSSIYTARFQVDESDNILHEMETSLGFLSQLGIECSREEIWPEIRTTEEEATWAQERLEPVKQGITLAIAPGVTSISDKYYAADNYAKALSGLEEKNLNVVIFGSGGEREQCGAVYDALKECSSIQTLLNLTGETNLGQLAECLKRCDLLLSNETGVLHMATTLRIPTIGILGGGHFKRFYPWGDPEINLFVHKPMECYFCNWYCIHDSIRCIHEIEPAQITEKAELLLRRIRKQQTLKEH